MNVRLESGVFLAGGSSKDNVLEKDAVLVYPGKFKSMDGDVEIKDSDISKLAEKHNSILKKATRLASGEPHPRVYPPIQLDHSKSAKDTVGRLIGDLTIGDYETGGKTVKALMGKVRILGKENVERVEDGRWTHLSIGADLKKHELSELTITPFPAASDATLLSKGDSHMGYSEMKAKMEMYEKCKKHMSGHKKMAEKEAEEKLAAMSDEDVKKMAEEHDEEEKKMASKKLADDEEKKKKDKEDGEKKMAAAKTEMTRLMSDFRKDSEAVQLAAKEANITVRLSRLQSSGKLTPAERKKIDVTQLAKSNEETINAVVESYEKREPVIIPGQMGGSKASDPATIAAEHKRLAKENLELETLDNMPMLKAQLTAQNDPRIAKLASPAEDHMKHKKMGEQPSEPGYAAHHDRHMYAEMEKDYETLSALTDEGKHDEAKEHLKKMREKMKKLASPAEEHMASEAEEKMSALAKQFASMQTKFEKIQELISQS